jgi:DNA-directed RNA polymerase sigma subunit (sigma70/sigma32)
MNATAVPSQKSHGFKEQLRIGREIADQLPVVTPLGVVAKQLGISKTMVRRIELRAFYKLKMKMLELRARGELE